MILPPRACSTPGCSGFAADGGLCLTCQPKAEPADKHDHHREWHNLYNLSRWKHPTRGLRALTLRRDIMCVICKRAPSTIADHIIDHRGNIVLFFDATNVRGICKPCHDKKTGGQHGGGNREPNRPPLVAGRVKDYAPKIIAVVASKAGFDFAKAVSQNPIDVPKARKVKWSPDEEA